MKTLNYKLLLLLLFISSVIYSCSNEDSLIPSPPPPIENNVITRSNGVVLDMPYISRPDLDNTSHKDTTDMWILYIRTDRYNENGEYDYGHKGQYIQLQYCKVNSFYDGDWKDAVIQMENPIYLKKSYYPFGEIYFRARTMDKEELAKIPGSRQYEYSYELSPWSYSLYAFNNIYNSDGISLTKNNIIVELNFIFNASYTGYLWEKDLSNFAASIKYGDKNLTYTVKDKYYKKSGYRETYTISMDKAYINYHGCSISVTNRTPGGYYISFDPMLFTIPTCPPNEITPPFSFDINVNLR